ncbi:uncharacterized protein LOC120272551 isoform X3 [Dioscorea cayenensis subsp. rotundata]|uniref:Uncharacterized protein LOC120272551 isoform X3 n=1 Tax=Dioscorea cayennensis subsp. rotundata TaxID=55577 RepID=A0AB40C6C6_DIOCR|nr:uncharacterized protein LOC120272551 isoform X3 [Dioscorea cayenensis subsp. rotundata]
METAAVRSGSIPATSSSSSSSSLPVRREWRAISEHAYRNNANEEVEHSKFGQTGERTIYEEAVGSLNVDFCAVTINGGNDVVLRKQLLDVCRRREELQQMEIQLRAQTIVQAEIMEVRNSYEAQLKEHSNATMKLKEQLQEREQHIRELELKVEEKDRELHAVNNEAAWAKEDFLREQNEKLATFRRERDNSEAEKAQHMKQIHDLQEHIKEKESHFLALEEQHRVAQDAILYKDEQLREAQAWIARLQEMGALQSSSFQAELRERTDQFHQYYMGFQRQVMEMERHHVQTIQQLQLEVAEARERNCVHSNSSQAPNGSAMDSSLYDKSQGNENNPVDSVTLNGTLKFMPNGKLNGTASVVSLSNTSSEVERVPGMPVVPSSIVGVDELPSSRHVDHCFPSSQVKSLSSFIMHLQGVPQSLSSTNSFISPFELHQHWQNHRVLPDDAHSTVDNEHQTSKADQNSLESGVHYKYELPVDKKEVCEDQLNNHINLQLTSGAKSNEPIAEVQLVKSIEKNPYHMSHEAEESLSTNSQFRGTYGFDPPQPNNELEVVESDERSYQTSPVQHENLTTNSKFHGTHGFDAPQQKNELKVHHETNSPSIILQKGPAFNLSQQWSGATMPVASTQINSVISSNIAKCNGNSSLASSPLAVGKAIELTLLDERSLLACIVRAIPAGSGNGIRISSTLPNRLGKMLAPLHWHDYKKKYGKLDDFVTQHPELFIIEGDFIHLREGAQEKISATAAAAKVAAAAASCAPYSSLLPSVAVTPVAQTTRLKKAQLSDSKPLISVQPTEGTDIPNHGDPPGGINAQIPKLHSQQVNGFNFNPQQARSDMKILSKTSLTNDIHEIHGSSEMRPDHLPNPVAGNGVNLNRTSLPPSQNKVSSNGRHASGGRRPVGVGFMSRR